jgi:hypothetical protein
LVINCDDDDIAVFADSFSILIRDSNYWQIFGNFCQLAIDGNFGRTIEQEKVMIFQTIFCHFIS